MLAFSIVGLILSVYFIAASFNERLEQLCNLGLTGGCDEILHSGFFIPAGIPLAIISFALYALVLYCARTIHNPPVLGKRGRWSHLQLIKFSAFLAGAGTLLLMYFRYVETFVVQHVNILGLLDQFFMFAILVASLVAISLIKDDVAKRQVCEFC